MQPEMARVTLDILGRTIFSDGLGQDLDRFATAINRYFATVGRLDPFDLLDFPEWLPRLTKLGSNSAQKFFAAVVETLIARRKRLLAKDKAGAPRDILTLLLEAQDPGNRRWIERHRSQGQYPDLYRGRARDHRQCLDLVPVSSHAIGGMAGEAHS